MGIVIAFLIFGLIITVHEFGHFIAAKANGIKVMEFSIGMGPRLFKFGKGETVYSFRLLPVGGFCAMEGEDQDSDDSRSFDKQNVWRRMIVLFAGAFMNFVLGFVLVTVMTSMGSSVPTLEISGFSGKKLEDDSVEYMASSYDSGLRTGDIITEMDGMRILTTTDIGYMMGQSSVHDVEVIRDGESILFEDVKFSNGISGSVIDFGLKSADKNILNVLSYSAKDSVSLGRLVWISLRDLVTGKYSAEELSGPVGVVSTISETASQGENLYEKVVSLLYLSALMSINIGIMNLLPIPSLDGGRLLFCFIELIRRKPVKQEHEAWVHIAGMVLVFGLIIFATFNDIKRLITGG